MEEVYTCITDYKYDGNGVRAAHAAKVVWQKHFQPHIKVFYQASALRVKDTLKQQQQLFFFQALTEV